ncbi:MAG: hypothetical protein JSU96_18900 [Acidobacteriota bacterium]|nr:MAG: hypothetical protein JSU96_18900 [Acidobacteriota bacterium]
MSSLLGQTSPPGKIDRTFEYLENNVETSAENALAELNEMAHQARVAAYRLVLAADETVRLTEGYFSEGSEVGADEFARQMREQLKEVQRLSSRVQSVGFLDPMSNHGKVAFSRARTPEQFKEQVEELSRLSRKVRSRVDSFFGLGGSVALGAFSESSLDGLTEDVQRLAKVISKTSGRF